MRCKIFQLLLPFFSLPLSAAYIKQPFPHSDLFDAIHSGSPYIISNSHPAFLGRLHAPLPPGPPLNNPGGQRSFSSPNPSPPPWVKHPPQDATSYSNSSEVSGGISSVQWSRVAGESLTLQVLRFENEGVLPRQECPGMVGPGSDGAYYCSEREKGYCDRRSGTCWCYAGYAGEDCSECDPFHHQDPSRPISASLRCIPNRLCPNDCSAAGACNYTTVSVKIFALVSGKCNTSVSNGNLLPKPTFLVFKPGLSRKCCMSQVSLRLVILLQRTLSIK